MGVMPRYTPKPTRRYTVTLLSGERRTVEASRVHNRGAFVIFYREVAGPAWPPPRPETVAIFNDRNLADVALEE